MKKYNRIITTILIAVVLGALTIIPLLQNPLKAVDIMEYSFLFSYEQYKYSSPLPVVSFDINEYKEIASVKNFSKSSFVNFSTNIMISPF